MGAEGPDRPGAAFEAELAALKREGCNLLAAGPESAGLHARACRQMFGDPDAGPRRHLFVFPEGSPAVGSGPADGGAEAAVVAGAGERRDATSDAVVRRVETADAGALAASVADEVARVDRETGGLEAAELRLCVDAVSGLVQRYGREPAVAFLDEVTAVVRDAGGIGHYHYAGDPTDAAVRRLAPIFEASVEFRVDEGPEQRWHLHDADLSSEWLPL